MLILSTVLFLIMITSSLSQADITINFMGDTMLGRLVDTTISSKGYKYPWGDMLAQVKSSTISILNLETTLTKSKQKVPKVFNYKATPDKVNTLVVADITVVNTANNHIRDFDISGMQETLKTLDQSGILHVGSGMTERAARAPVILETDGITIGIIGATDNEPGWAAEGKTPGTNYVDLEDMQKISGPHTSGVYPEPRRRDKLRMSGTSNTYIRLQSDIKNLKKEVDLVILTIHWGPNMRQKPTREFINFAHGAIDAGVDIFHGHSAHIFQGIEIYKNKVIMYDTGDFIDDYAVDQELRNDQSFLFTLTVTKKDKKIGVSKIQLTPVLIDNMQVNKAHGKTAREIMRKMQKLSGEFKTKISDAGEIVVTEL